MRSHALSLAALAVSMSLVACGTSTRAPVPSSASKVVQNLGGTKTDSEGYELEVPDPREDGGDDMTIYSFGHQASATEAQAITEVVNRYYAAAASGDGASGCALMPSILARSIPESYGRPPGPSYLSGKTCAVVMTKLFKRSHRILAGPTTVTGVRIRGQDGRVLLRSRTLPFVYTRVQRERGAWKVAALIGAQLP